MVNLSIKINGYRYERLDSITEAIDNFREEAIDIVKEEIEFALANLGLPEDTIEDVKDAAQRAIEAIQVRE
jgi:hypothetical protein